MKDDHTENDPFEEDELFRSHDNFHVLSPEEIEKQNRDKGVIATYGGNRENRYGNSSLVSVGVKINGEDHFKETSIQLELKQFLNAKHEFTLRADPDEFGESNANLLEHSRKHLGSKITFFFNQYGKTASTFTGIITRISTRKEEGISYVFIEGKSPSILMEDGLNCRSFENKSFEEIINEVIKDYPKNLISYHINPEYKDKLPYTVQYMESDFAFLQRLFSRYGEYHYYNGESFCLSPFGGRITELMEGEDIYNYGLQLELKPQNFSFTSYDPKQGKTNTLNSKDKQIQQSENPFQQFAKNVSENTFPTSPTVHYNNSLLPNGTRDLQKAVEREQKKRQNLVYMEAATNNPSLRIGDVAKMMIHIPGHRIFKNGRVPVESYKIISLIHRFADGEGYSNTFVGVPKDLTVPDNYNPNDHPRAEVQHAIVTDNKDPLKMGRIRIKFPWQEQDNQQTPWVQVLQPHAGQGKGTYMNPEIGESVLCAFQGGNAECPVVSGTAYNGSEIAAYYTEGNDIKVIQTRSGTKIIFNDADKSILVEDPSGSSVLLDGQGNIKVKAPNNMELKAGNDINIEAGNNFNLRVGNQTRLDSFTSIQMTTPVLKQNISDYFRSQSATALISTTKEMKIESPDTSIAGRNNLFLHSDNRAVINSKKVAEMKGQAQNSFSNTPDEYTLQEIETEPIALACVEFLPGEGPDPEQNPYITGEDKKLRYAGHFGLDYFRKKNQNTREERPYFDALTNHPKETGYYNGGIKEGENENGKFTYTTYPQYENRREQYNALCREYERLPILYREKKDIVQGYEEENLYYYVPYLTLYSKEYTETLTTKHKPRYEAYLSLAVEITEDLDSLEFDYDKTLFSHSLETPLELKKCTSTVHICNVKISCLKDFDREQEIKVYAYPKGSKAKSETEKRTLRKLAGKVKVLPNSAQHRKKLKVLVMQVETNVNDDIDKRKYQRGNFTEFQEEQLYKFFYQAYIEPEIEYYAGKDGRNYLDLTGDKRFKKNSEYITIDGEMKNMSTNIREECQEYLEQYLPEDKKGSVVLYFFGLECFIVDPEDINKKNIKGGDSYLQSKRCFIYSEGNRKVRHASDHTPAHEAGHSLGLWHTFYDIFGESYETGKYFFIKHTTNNLMDYNVPRRFLYKWQWEILRSRI